MKKLSRPFQSLIHSRRSYRELRLLKHMKHENVSACYKNTQRRTETACFRLCYWSALLVSVSAGNRAAGRLHTRCGTRGLQWTVSLSSLDVYHEIYSCPRFHKNAKILLLEGRVVLVEATPGDFWLVKMCNGCHGSITVFPSYWNSPNPPFTHTLSPFFQLPGD